MGNEKHDESRLARAIRIKQSSSIRSILHARTLHRNVSRNSIISPQSSAADHLNPRVSGIRGGGEAAQARGFARIRSDKCELRIEARNDAITGQMIRKAVGATR